MQLLNQRQLGQIAGGCQFCQWKTEMKQAAYTWAANEWHDTSYLQLGTTTVAMMALMESATPTCQPLRRYLQYYPFGF